MLKMANDERIKKLQLLLKELFQFENNDLDFGIYRIINIKRKEISEFINKELFDIIKEKIKTVEENTELQKSLEILKNEIKITFGCDIQEAKTKYAETPKVNEYINKEKELKVADKENEIEEEIYDDIINFFSRYYDKGDFISKKRYSKDNKYAIPYNGEEVYLYWANNDQYYVKTAEDFKNYSFKVGELKVNFEIESEEVDVEKNNIKDKENKFFIFKDVDYDTRSKKLVIQFGYRRLNEKEKQAISEDSDKKSIGKDEVNKYNISQIQEKIGIYGLSDLLKKHTRMDGGKSDKSELEWHLNKYTTKNTSDYFIHKDLKKFLNQELDFYIKNELFHIDEIDSKENLDISLKRVKVFKEISQKIIEFLSQIENFQKKLWEKKKFVVSTNYCITLDLIDEKHYPAILKNQAQLEEWKTLYSYDIEVEVKKLLEKLTGQGKNDDEKKIDLLKQNHTLTLDTKFYDIDFKYRILSEIDNLDEKTTGILVNSENFQALSLMENKIRNRVKTGYYDPPYNTGGSKFIYKNEFQHSSWNAMILDRLQITRSLLNEDGTLITAIDDFELDNLNKILKYVFGSENHLGILVIEIKPSGRTNDFYFSTSHEYCIFIAKNKVLTDINFFELSQEQLSAYKHQDVESAYKWRDFLRTGGYSTPEERPNSFYPIYYNEKKGELQLEKESDFIEIFPIDSFGNKRVWRKTPPSFLKHLEKKEIQVVKNRDGDYKIQLIDRVKKGIRPKSLWVGSKYDAATYGTKLLKDIIPNSPFSYPKSIFAVKDCIQISMNEDNSDYVLDIFAGSGTTGHAVMKLNKEDEGNRKFILVEMGQYFDTVLKPRILKVIYSDNWKEGKPQDNNGSYKQIIKYQTLEQYEDSLNNIDFKEPNKLAKESKDYQIKYMLEFEAKDNNVFLNLSALDNPFEYKLKIENNNEIKECNVDLVETFNYIAGIDVKSIQKKQDIKVDYIIVKGQRNDKNVIVIWRNKTDGFEPKRDKEFVEKEILKEEYDEILINGNSLIADAKSVDEVFKAHMFKG